MNEQQIKNIARGVFNEMQGSSSFSSFQTSSHLHNSSDSPRINEGDLIRGDKYIAGILADDTGSGADILTITNGVSNPSRIAFYGIAQNPKTGTAIQKATITGEAQLGRCYINHGNQTIIPIQDNIIQTCASTSFDGYSLEQPLTLTAGVTAGDTSATLSTSWGGGTQLEFVVFSSGENRPVLFGAGIPNLFWNDPLTANASSTINLITSYIPRVNVDGTALASWVDSQHGTLPAIKVIAWTDTSITLQSSIAPSSGWKVTANLIIT